MSTAGLRRVLGSSPGAVKTRTPSEDHRGPLEQGTEHTGLCNELATPSRVSLPPPETVEGQQVPVSPGWAAEEQFNL